MDIKDLPGMGDSTAKNIAVGFVYLLVVSAVIGTFAEDPENFDENDIETDGSQNLEDSSDTETSSNRNNEDSSSEKNDEESSSSDGESASSNEELEDIEPPDPIVSTYSGTGNSVVDGVEPELLGPTVFSMEHDGSSNFAIELYDSGDQLQDVIVNKIGEYNGENARDIFGGHSLDITADGGWTIEVTEHPIYGLNEFDHSWPVEHASNSDSVIGPLDFSSGRTLTVDAEGDGNNVVTIRNAEGGVVDVAVNEIGATQSSTIVSTRGDVGWIDTEMSGSYSITLEE